MWILFSPVHNTFAVNNANNLTFSNIFTGGKIYHCDKHYVLQLLFGALVLCLFTQLWLDSWTSAIKQHHNERETRIAFAPILGYLSNLRYSIYYYLDISDSNGVSNAVGKLSIRERNKWYSDWCGGQLNDKWKKQAILQVAWLTRYG